jgi:glycine cleavage system H protein
MEVLIMRFPENYKYSKSHEWVEFLEDGTVKLGLTEYAQEEMGDLVFVNLPEPGDEVTAGEAFGDVESVKAVSDVFSPISGIVKDINEDLLDNPALINQDANSAYLIIVSDVEEQEELISAKEYEDYIAQL